MDLFSSINNKNFKKAEPLASRMRPATLEEVVGQYEIIAPGKLLRKAIETDNLVSVIFYGPPGTGKTTLANVIANTTKRHFEKINAVTSGKEEIKKLIKEASDRLGIDGRKTIVFIDEIHRFNKGQQDALLPSVEDGIIGLIGATTENPFFSVNSPLLSRSLIFRLNPLSIEDIISLLKRSLSDEDKGLGIYKTKISNDILHHLAEWAQGDGRIALNTLELAVLATPPDSSGVRLIDMQIIEDCIQKPLMLYDKNGDQHYDVISAFIKSIRGSDPNATLHYLARMLEAGEDPRFIGRRLVVHAAEDIGLADPQALVIAQSAAQAVDFIGLPEGRLVLAQAALYLALAPKSNKVLTSIDDAIKDVRQGKIGLVPLHLRDSHYPGAKELGHGEGYIYPPDNPKGKQNYLPPELIGREYFKLDK